MSGASVASARQRGGCARPHPRPTGGGRGGGDKTRRARKRANTHGKQECTRATPKGLFARELRRRYNLNPRGRPRPLDAAEGWLLQPSHASDTRPACQWRGWDTTAAANARERATEGKRAPTATAPSQGHRDGKPTETGGGSEGGGA